MGLYSNFRGCTTDPFGSGNFFGSSLQSFMQSSLKCRRQQGILQAENAVGMSCDVFCMSEKIEVTVMTLKKMETFRPSKSCGVGVLIIFLAAMLCLFYYLYPEPPMSTSTILSRMKSIFWVIPARTNIFCLKTF